VLTNEHVLSRANFGGRLVAPKRVCESCNSEAGGLEDKILTVPPLIEFVGVAARELGRGYPEAEAILQDGARGRAEITPDGTRVISFKPRKIGMEGDTEVWEVGEGDEKKVEDRRSKPGRRVKAVGRPLGQGDYMQLAGGFGVDFFEMWPRFAAKVALGCASLTLPEAWLDSEGARLVQDLFQRGNAPKRLWRGRGPKVPLGWPELPPDDPLRRALRRSEHILALSANDEGDGTLLEMVLFGAIYYRLDLFDAECPDDEPAWLVSPSSRSGREPSEVLRARLLARVDEA
jgi:hypothetical protein